MPERVAVIKEIKDFWGPHFTKPYIPMHRRPRIHDPSWGRPEYELYEGNAGAWPLSVLKGILDIAKLTSERDWVRNAINKVVNYRIRNTKDRTPHVTAVDCEVIEEMFLHKWDVVDAFKRSPLFRHMKQDKSNEEIKPTLHASREFKDEGDRNPKNEELKSYRSNKRGPDFGPGARQHGVAAASSKAQTKDKHTQNPTSETLSSVSRGKKQKKRKRSAVEDALLETIPVPLNREDSTKDHTSGCSHAKHPGYDICPSSSSSLCQSSPPPQSSTTKLINRNISRYGMFPPPPPSRITTPPVQNTPETRNKRDNVQVKSEQDVIDLTVASPDRREDDATVRFENDDHNDDDEEEDEDDDQNIFNAKIAAAEAALNLAQLRVAAARKAKKARKSASNRRNSTSSL